ncbi:MAG: hypothetical protein MZU91_13495 [Desulfosudis oleivorans]|nr:hypothetical protein [Desulfosudis oleivorans]
MGGAKVIAAGNAVKKIAGDEAAGDFYIEGARNQRTDQVFFSSWNSPCQVHLLQKVSVVS